MNEFNGNQLMQKLRTLDNGSLAKLRRGLKSGANSQISASLVLWSIVPSDLSDFLVDICRAVAALYAIHGKHTEAPVSIGSAMGQAVDGNANSATARLERLLKADRARAIELLEGTVRLLAQRGVVLNFAKLFDDLRYWAPVPKSDSVQNRWARDFFIALA